MSRTDDSLRDVLEKLNQHGEILARLEERSRNDSAASLKRDERLDSHAGKIRALEHWRNALSGGFAVVVGWLGLK